MNPTLRRSVVGCGFRSATHVDVNERTRVESVASCALRPQFRDTDQVEGRAAEHEQPIYLRKPTQFYLLQRADLLQPSEPFLYQPALA
jgi:hypothetical protein